MGNLYMGYNLNTQRYFFYSNLNLLKLWDVVAAVGGPQPKSEFGDFGLKLGLGIRTQVYMYILKIICLVGFDLMMQTRVKMMTRLKGR